MASVNIAEEVSPWAIIIILAPASPVEDRERVPAIMRAICPMEE